MTHRIFKQRPSKKLVNYGLIGITAFVSEFLIFSLLVTLIPLIASQSISFGVGLVISFMGNRLITFKTGSFKYGVKRQFVSYLTLACINLILTNIIIYIQVEHLEFTPLLAKIITMFFVVGWNFLFFQRYIFRSN